MVNLKSLPDEGRPGATSHRLPYARLRSSHKSKTNVSGSECLRFNSYASQMAGFKHKERVNLFWDSDNYLVGIFRGGNQRSVQIWGNGRSRWATLHITSLIRLYQIPFHRHPLPVSCDPDGNVWIDFSGEKAPTKYLPGTIRCKDPEISFTEKRIAKLCVRLSDHSQISNKTWPTLLELFQEISKAEGYPSFSKWVDTVLSHHIQDHHSCVWEAFIESKDS